MSVAGSFGPTFFFRVILPGVILATGLQPVVFPLYAALHVDSLYGLSAAGLFGVVAVASGLILAAADRPIYYLFEGFSLPLLTEWNRKRLSRRVDVLAERQEELAKKAGKKTLSAAQQLEAMRLAEQLRDIPVGVGAIGPQYQRGGPTKLANIIAAYELYSKSRYGIDGEFFLPHAFYLAEEGVRADLESSGAIADGMVLSCFGAIVASLAHIIVGFGMVLGAIVTKLHRSPLGVSPERPSLAILYAVAAALAATLFYALSLSAHREYGRRVRAVVDIVAKKLETLATTPLPSDAVKKAIQARREYLETLYRE